VCCTKAFIFRIAVLALVATALLPFRAANAQKVAAVLVANSLDSKSLPQQAIGAGFAANLSLVKLLLNDAAKKGAIDVSVVEIQDKEFNCKSITTAVDRMKVTTDDTVVFYYAGHGFRRPNTPTEFPLFDCKISPPDAAADPEIGLSTIVDTLTKDKKPRLVLAIADACNVVVPLPPSVRPRAAPSELIAGPDVRSAFQRLFFEYRGRLMLSGSVPGEFSYYLNGGPSIGGFFTNQLVGAITNEITSRGPKVTWEEIAADATKPIPIPGYSYQHPQFAAYGLVRDVVPLTATGSFITRPNSR
jgi:hypothetical protein